MWKVEVQIYLRNYYYNSAGSRDKVLDRIMSIERKMSVKNDSKVQGVNCVASGER
jgi:hypothetical protein